MKIIESNILYNEEKGNLLFVKYEHDGKVNTLPLYIIKDNELVAYE